MESDFSEMRDDVASATQGVTLTTGAISIASSSMTVGYVMWALRGGWLASSLLAQMPAWRLMDPLVVLSDLTGIDENDEAGDESLQDMLESQTPDEPIHDGSTAAAQS